MLIVSASPLFMEESSEADEAHQCDQVERGMTSSRTRHFQIAQTLISSQVVADELLQLSQQPEWMDWIDLPY